MDRRLKNDVYPCDLLSLVLQRFYRINIFGLIPSNKHQNVTTVRRQAWNARQMDRHVSEHVCSSILNWTLKPDYGGMRCLKVGFLNIPYLIKENESLWPLPLTLIWYNSILQDVPNFSALNRDAMTTNFHRPFLCFWRKKCIYSVGERRCSEVTFGSAAFSS